MNPLNEAAVEKLCKMLHGDEELSKLAMEIIEGYTCVNLTYVKQRDYIKVYEEAIRNKLWLIELNDVIQQKWT